MSDAPDFIGMPKIARLSREMIVTEKIDGTNASIHIAEDGTMRFGSRTRWITPVDDNFGFARWASEHADELRKLGPGSHFGEWWGRGIQRGYGLQERRFSLFNVSRWVSAMLDGSWPECLTVVPVLDRGPFNTLAIEDSLAYLDKGGSFAAPGFMKPEGVVVYHVATRQLFKKTLDNNDGHKEQA